MIEGGKPLSGTIVIQGAKNAALPILAASMLVEGTRMIEHVPNLLDIDVMLSILSRLGCRAEHEGRAGYHRHVDPSLPRRFQKI